MLQPVGTLGNVQRNGLLGPGFNEMDFAVKKDTQLGPFWVRPETWNSGPSSSTFSIKTNFGMPSPDSRLLGA